MTLLGDMELVIVAEGKYWNGALEHAGVKNPPPATLALTARQKGA
jgi:hypothetical protein